MNRSTTLFFSMQNVHSQEKQVEDARHRSCGHESTYFHSGPMIMCTSQILFFEVKSYEEIR